MQNTSSSIIFAPNMQHTPLSNFDKIDQNIIIENTTISKNWNLGPEKSIKYAELFAIYQATCWALKSIKPVEFDRKIWIFTDSQGAIKNIQKLSNAGMARDIRANIRLLTKSGYNLISNWIPSHQKIYGNEKADQMAKLGQKNPKIENLPTFDYFRNRIKNDIINRWDENWQKSKSKKLYYSQFNTSPRDHKIKITVNNKLIFATIMQLKLGHDYFRSYLNRLPNYDSAKCTGQCVDRQTPEHLLLCCKHYANDIIKMKRNIGQPVNFQILMITKIGLENLIKYLTTTKLATKKWILGQDPDKNTPNDGGWGEIER